MTAGLFEPENQRPLDDLITDKDNMLKHMEGEVIVFYDILANVIRGWDPVEGIFDIVDRQGVKDLKFFDGYLYDGGDCGIFDTLTNGDIVDTPGGVSAFCFHDGHVYYGTINGQIYDGTNGDRLADRDGIVFSLLSYNGSLYDAGEYDTIYRNVVFQEYKHHPFEQVHSMIEWNNDILVSGRGKEIVSVYGRDTFPTPLDTEYIPSMFYYHGNVAYMTGVHEIYDFESYDQITDLSGYFVDEVVAVPKKLFGRNFL